MKIRLQVSVAATFALLTALVLAVTVGLFFVNNRELAINTARGAMAAAQGRTAAALDAVILPVVRTVATMARLVENFPAEARGARGLGIAAAEIAELPQVYGLYIADAATGDFVQVAQLVPGQATFGNEEVPVPAGAVTARRVIRGEGAARQAETTFHAGDGRVAGHAVRAATFDPRSRVWYQRAAAAEGTIISPVYLFSSSERPGVTFSQAVRGPDGAVAAVVGADMSMDSVAAILSAIRVDGVGETFLLDQNGTLVVSSEQTGADARRPLTETAVAGWGGEDNAFFRFAFPGVQGGYLVAVAHLPPMLGTHPYLGVVVPTQHYTGAIAATTKRVIALSAAVGLAAMAATVLLARLLSGPLRQVADEAHRISAFDLGGRFEMQSRITEVAELGAAVAKMKNSLRSFTAYVPKKVVRALVASGGTVAVGGAAREVSLMFSDIEGFTRKSEALPPEAVMGDLSRYFEAMAQAVASTGGTVDKFIGDAVMAIWNAPSKVEHHAAAACRGALACRAAEAALNTAGLGGIFPVRTRIGLHCDRVVVGNVGSTSRLQYTAIGGAVNLASRVEGLNKVYGTAILATQAVVERAGDGFLFRPVDLVAPAGTTRPVALYELVGERGGVPEAAQHGLEAWAAALALYRGRDWRGAAAGFAALRGGGVPDRLVALYIDRCDAFATTPPGEGWAGVTFLTEK